MFNPRASKVEKYQDCKAKLGGVDCSKKPMPEDAREQVKELRGVVNRISKEALRGRFFSRPTDCGDDQIALRDRKQIVRGRMTIPCQDAEAFKQSFGNILTAAKPQEPATFTAAVKAFFTPTPTPTTTAAPTPTPKP